MAKYDIKNTSRLKFARFGGLSSVNQRGYEPSSEDFHGPPARRGFYCFVWPFYELFLLGADCTKNPMVKGAKFIYVRDNKGEIITDIHPEYEEYSKNCCKHSQINNPKWSEFYESHCTHPEADWDSLEKEWKSKNIPKYYFIEKPKPRIFEYSGEIWHHLGEHLKQDLILGTKDSWVKSTVEDYRDALDKNMLSAHKQMMKWSYNTTHRVLPTHKMALSRGTKDHLECFIEKL